MQGVSFLQISDVHFGASPGGGRLGLPRRVAAVRVEEQRQAFSRAIAVVQERDLDGLLIPGDLFDDESVATDTLRFLHHQMESLAPRPVFIAPGNHDPYGGTSPYSTTAHDVARGLRWPDNVVIFAHEDFRTVHWPGRDDVAVTGCGVAANVPSGLRRLAARVPRADADLNLLLFHGSRDDGHWLQSNKATYPFSSEELLAQGFDWVALGHYHGRQIVDAADGTPRAAYAGGLTALRADETGAKGGLIVRVSASEVRVEQVVLDPRQVRRVVVDLEGATFAEEARRRVDDALDAAECGPADMVLLELTGRRARGLDLDFLRALPERFFHARWDSSRLAPDVDLDQLEHTAATTEQRFVSRLRPRLDDDPDGVARRALLYGLDALERGRLEVRYEDHG